MRVYSQSQNERGRGAATMQVNLARQRRSSARYNVERSLAVRGRKCAHLLDLLREDAEEHRHAARHGSHVRRVVRESLHQSARIRKTSHPKHVHNPVIEVERLNVAERRLKRILVRCSCSRSLVDIATPHSMAVASFG